MDLYEKTSYQVSRLITRNYSTSFSSSITLFSKDIQPHIYAIYGITRVADEIVDTYRQKDARILLKELESDVYDAIKRGYSANPVISAFALTAKKYGISKELLQPFFISMAMDLEPKKYTSALYHTYIHGSAEVVGLMCLRVFIEGDAKKFATFKTSACALGSAYQKINFLRDLAADYELLGRVYFPGVTFEGFDESTKNDIIRDIESDLQKAEGGLRNLPASSRYAVELSVRYYGRLVKKIKQTPADVIKKKRIRVGTTMKLWILVSSKIKGWYRG